MDTRGGSSHVPPCRLPWMYIWYHEKEIVLEFSMFTGKLGCGQASSFVMIDKAIAKFEEEHPG